MFVNFNSIVSVYVIKNYISEEEGYKGYNIDFATNEEINFVLATYDTEERAKEVFKDIISRYEAIELCKREYSISNILGYTLGDYTPIYEMPKE